MFDSHVLNSFGFDQMTLFKKAMADTVRAVAHLMPEGREKAIFMTKMEEGVFFGAKAIAAAADNHTEVKSF